VVLPEWNLAAKGARPADFLKRDTGIHLHWGVGRGQTHIVEVELHKFRG